ncbi:MAG: DUF1015 domain-containing protein [Spirochaetes bacterium]|nr:DUF1015 domain-containing protein [Spirochaetota bacterium]
MIHIKPFKALRPKKDLYPAIVSLPYDVMTIKEMKQIILKQQLSFLRIIRSEVDFDDDVNPYSEEVYNKAKENLCDFIKKGYLVQDDVPCFYIYRQKKGDFQQIGFVGTVSVLDYEKGIIKKHEKTRTVKENDRIHHIETLNAQTGFVFLKYRSESCLDRILEETQSSVPEVDFVTEDNITHTLWVIKEPQVINNIIEGFKKIPCLYIADGHHRAAASLAVSKKNSNSSIEKESDYFLSIIFPHSKLQVFAYNRAVKDLYDNTYEEFIDKVKNNFSVEKVDSNNKNGGYKPEAPKQIGMYLNGQWYLLKAKDSIINNDSVFSLDVSLLQNYILNQILGVKDPKINKRINFIGGIRGTGVLKEMVDSKKYAVAFSMYPTSINQLMAVSDDNKLMPPKSTWFEPKPRSGIAIHLLD